MRYESRGGNGRRCAHRRFLQAAHGCCLCRASTLTAIAQNETQQLTADGSDNLWLVLASCQQLLIASAKPPLRFPGDSFDLFIESLLALGQPASNPRLILIGPGTLHQHMSEMGIAGFGDAAALDVLAAGVLTRHQPAVAHQLSRITEA